MKRAAITDFLKELLGRNVPSKLINGWVSMPCPLAPWTHQKQHDNHPSFGVRIQEKGQKVSIFNCYTCKKKGTLSHLATLYQNYSGQDKSHLIDEAEDIELFGVQLPLWDDLGIPEMHLEPPTPIGEEYHDIFEPAYRTITRSSRREVHPYLRRRGINYVAARKMELCLDPDDGHGATRIIFPVYGTEADLYGYTGRAIDDAVVPRIRDYYGLPKRACLLGVHLVPLSLGTTPIILCEGLLDYARLTEYGQLAVAAMHSGLTEMQARILRSLGRRVILMYDNDDAGKKGAAQATELLGQYVPLQKVRYPEGVDDPGGASLEQITWMLLNSRLA